MTALFATANAAACANWLLDPTIKLEKLYLKFIELKLWVKFLGFFSGFVAFVKGNRSFSLSEPTSVLNSTWIDLFVKKSRVDFIIL